MKDERYMLLKLFLKIFRSCYIRDGDVNLVNLVLLALFLGWVY